MRAVHLDRKGRGLALRTAWTASDAAVVAYMDVDLSTDLDALLPLVAPLVSGHSDVAIGSRSRAGRVGGAPAEAGAHLALLQRDPAHGVRDAACSDAQCGFKAVRADVARRLLPAIEDDGWFFDTELLLLAERNGLRIHEVPVDWIDDADSRVHIVRTALDDLAGHRAHGADVPRAAAAASISATRPARPSPTTSAARIVSSALVGVADRRRLARAVRSCWRAPIGARAGAAIALAWTAAAAGRSRSMRDRSASHPSNGAVVTDDRRRAHAEVVDRPSGSRFDARDELAPGGRPRAARAVRAAAAPTIPRGRVPRCSRCSARPRCSTSGASARRAGRTRITRRRCRPGSKSWKAFFFGSLDAGNSITVDKSPGFLWVMEISARIFGVNSWSILVPQALEGVAAVGVLYATVRRWFTPAAGAARRRGARDSRRSPR